MDQKFLKKLQLLQSLQELHCGNNIPGDCRIPATMNTDDEHEITTDCTGCKQVIKTIQQIIMTDGPESVDSMTAQQKEYFVGILNGIYREIKLKAGK